MQPSFASNRLNYTPMTKKDIPLVFALHSHPEVAQYNTIGVPKNESVTARILAEKINPENSKNLGWALYDFSQEFIGEMGLILSPERFQKAEISYSISPAHWNQGYATEAVKKGLEFAFITLRLHRIEAGVAVANLSSIRVLEKVGMKREGQHKQILPLPSGWSDNYSYAILREDYLSCANQA